MTGRNVIITGANSGIGRAAARALSGAGAHVVLAVRATDKGETAAAAMPGETEVRRLDLASLASVREFAAGWDGDIALLINNALKHKGISCRFRAKLALLCKVAARRGAL